MLGADMLIKTAFKALGVDAESIMPMLMQFREWAVNSIVGFDQRLKRMEETAALLAQQNAEFIAMLKATNPALQNHALLKEEIQNEPN